MGKKDTPNGRHVVATIKDEWAHIILRDDDIAEIHLRPRGYNRGLVNQIIDKIRSLQKSEYLYVLILADPKSSVDFGGIKGLFSRKSLTYSVAKAYVIHKPVHFLIAKICLFVYRPKTPIRFFRERDAAESWLSGFIGYGI